MADFRDIALLISINKEKNVSMLSANRVKGKSCIFTNDKLLSKQCEKKQVTTEYVCRSRLFYVAYYVTANSLWCLLT